ncbi:MAG: hypothetical protein ACKO0V_01270 [bacterium]
MSSEKKTGLGSVPAGLLRPTTRPDSKEKDKPAPLVEEPVEATAEPEPEAASKEPETATPAAAGAGQQAAASSPKPTRGSRKRKSAAESERVVPWKIYLPESIHFRLRQLAYERGLKLSEAAAEVLDRGLPFYEIVRKDRAG